MDFLFGRHLPLLTSVFRRGERGSSSYSDDNGYKDKDEDEGRGDAKSRKPYRKPGMKKGKHGRSSTFTNIATTGWAKADNTLEFDYPSDNP